MNAPELPHNDKDLQLARRIGKLLDSRQLGAESIGQDEFERMLDGFKRSQVAQAQTPAPDVTRSMWDAIAAATEPDQTQQKRPANIFSLHSYVGRMAVAASVLIAVALGWYMMRPTTSPVLVAEAGSSSFVYTADDGSVISLRPQSSLYEIDDNRYALEGEAHFVVTSDPSRTFSVDAGAARISVLGTTFSITHRDTLVSVYLEEGSIRLEHLTKQQSQILAPGQAGLLSARSDISIDQAPDADEYLDWLDDELRFRSKSIKDIVEELEFHFAVTIEIPATVEEETLTGFLSLASIDVALEKLSFTMGSGRFEQAGEQTYRFIPTE